MEYLKWRLRDFSKHSARQFLLVKTSIELKLGFLLNFDFFIFLKAFLSGKLMTFGAKFWIDGNSKYSQSKKG
ncbi:hypothetical protein BpHYR1_000901 [Brachionus plicatilis]|uniref:Uncharacterized protein n=1 Tax=Brachionus plicatilis TaxID=10195 RepID=A0A3M7SF89_BRAPC|nr:hypothetical protein BpHYR1_000901 [Brachionus plicatilis]